MKNFSKITFVLFFCIAFFACSEDEQFGQTDLLDNSALIDNSENIEKLINSFDFVVKESIANPSLSNEKLGELFIEESKRNGLSIINLNTKSRLAKSNSENFEFTEQYLAFSKEIQSSSNSSTKDEFKSNLINLRSRVFDSYISIEEKQLLIDNISFMTAFVDWMSDLEKNNSFKSDFALKIGCDGWWSCWGKCVAGTIGGAITGSIVGCGVGGGIGAGVGAAIAAIPSLGIAAPVGAGVGAVVGCAAGSAAGAIGGGLTGAATFCE